MKGITIGLCLLALVSAAPAGIVFSENFDGEGSAAGNPINGYNGWSGHETMVFSDTVIDSGLSAGAVAGVNWPNVAKSFSYTPAADEVYTLTATLYISQADQYASVEMDMGGLMPLYAGLGASAVGRLEFGFYTDEEWNEYITVATTAYTVGDAIDIQAVVTNGNADCYYRVHGSSEWTLVGSLTDDAIVPADFNRVKVSNRGGVVGGRTDSILLTSEVVPEPVTLGLLSVGGLGILLRRRR